MVHHAVRLALLSQVMGLVIAVPSAIAAPGKIAQCNSLSTAVGKLKPIADQFEQEGKKIQTTATQAGRQNDWQSFRTAATTSATAFEQIAGDFGRATQQIETVPLNDKMLVTPRRQYVDNSNTILLTIQDTSSIVRSVSQISEPETGSAELRQAGERMNSLQARIVGIVKEENRIVTSFNRYCRAR